MLSLVSCLRQYGVGRPIREPALSVPPAGFERVDADGRPVRILFLGTSLTAGGRWSDVLRQRLSACRAAGVIVERLAKPGANSAWGEEALRIRLASGPVPDLMVVEFSINDSSLWRGMTLAASRVRHEAILQMAKKAGATVWLATMSPAFGRKAWERPGQGAYRELYDDMARAQGAGLIAMSSTWLALGSLDRQAAMPDGLHPTDTAMVTLAVPDLVSALRLAVCDPA